MQPAISSAAIELDHVFIMTSAGAPEASRLIEAGFAEGAPNTHPGQGTACRRFSFLNAMVELLWVNDPLEAQSHRTSTTKLWDRWAGRESGASPFGICTRPAIPGTTGAPFPAGEYRPAYLPPELCMYVGPAGIDEPMWVHLDFITRENRVHNFTGHPNGARAITGVRLTAPSSTCKNGRAPNCTSQHHQARNVHPRISSNSPAAWSVNGSAGS